MDTKAVFAALYSVCEENAAFFSGGAKGSQGDAARRLVETMKLIQEHAHSLEPVVSGFAAVYHHFDFDPHIPANGYRSLVKVGRGMFGSLCVCIVKPLSCACVLISAEFGFEKASPHTATHSYQYSAHIVRNGSAAPCAFILLCFKVSLFVLQIDFMLQIRLDKSLQLENIYHNCTHCTLSSTVIDETSWPSVAAAHHNWMSLAEQ